MKKVICTIMCFTIFVSCNQNRKTFEKEYSVGEFGNAVKIEYYTNIEGEAFALTDTPLFIITDRLELENILAEINQADNPELWKGAGWNRIKLYFNDTIININTNDKKIGLTASGLFYDLETDNFITRRQIEK